MTRSALNYDRDLVSALSGIEDFGPSKTVQADAQSADINNIVREFGLTGKLPQGVRVPSYGDFTDAVEDYQTAQNAILEAQASFMALPASIRSRFHNSPQAFLEYCSNEANLPEMRAMGLAVPETQVPSPADGDAKGKAEKSSRRVDPPADPSE